MALPRKKLSGQAYNTTLCKYSFGDRFYWRAFLLSVGAALAGFVFTASAVAFSEGGPLVIVYTQKQKPACAAAGRDKKSR